MKDIKVETKNNEETEGVSKSRNPLLHGLHALAVDIGLSEMLMFMAGFVIGFTGSPIGENFIEHPIFTAAGLLVSIYAAYIMRRRHSDKLEALFGLLAFSVITNSIIFASEPQSMWLMILAIVGQVIAYGLGWQLAKDDSFRVMLPSRGWSRAFSIVGYVALFFVALMAIDLF